MSSERIEMLWSLIILPIIVIGIVLLTSYSIYSLAQSNESCHTGCRKLDYYAGESVDNLYEHDVCVCFTKEPGPLHYYVSGLSSRLESEVNN